MFQFISSNMNVALNNGQSACSTKARIINVIGLDAVRGGCTVAPNLYVCDCTSSTWEETSLFSSSSQPAWRCTTHWQSSKFPRHTHTRIVDYWKMSELLRSARKHEPSKRTYLHKKLSKLSKVFYEMGPMNLLDNGFIYSTFQQFFTSSH